MIEFCRGIFLQTLLLPKGTTVILMVLSALFLNACDNQNAVPPMRLGAHSSVDARSMYELNNVRNYARWALNTVLHKLNPNHRQEHRSSSTHVKNVFVEPQGRDWLLTESIENLHQNQFGDWVVDGQVKELFEGRKGPLMLHRWDVYFFPESYNDKSTITTIERRERASV